MGAVVELNAARLRRLIGCSSTSADRSEGRRRFTVANGVARDRDAAARYRRSSSYLRLVAAEIRESNITPCVVGRLIELYRELVTGQCTRRVRELNLIYASVALACHYNRL